jgi:signal transduction histidine kinase
VQAGQAEGLDDLALRTLDGQHRWADLRVSLVPPRMDAQSGPMYLCVLNDRTARVEAQRARELAETAEHQRDLAQSASRAKTQLLSRVSHELRTPLNAVIGFSNLLLIEPVTLDADSQRKVRHIRDAGQHLLALVDEVLEINRAEAGQLGLAHQPVNLTGLVHEVLTMQVELAENSTPPVALADPRRVREVLNNLVVNAIKYNRPGGWLRLRLGADERHAWVEVSDSGIGMSSEQLAHLFEPFNRLGAERLAVAGHGLGLSIARTLTQAMGGTLRVASSPGEGSCFTLHLPSAGGTRRAASAASMPASNGDAPAERRYSEAGRG